MENRRYAIVFNGEIYNHLELRRELTGIKFRTRSDTETLLELFSEYGLEETLSKINGMFAIGLFDKQNQTITLIRDRLGIKPLYYAWENNDFVFASEINGLPEELLTSVNDQAVVQAVSLGYITDSSSYYRLVNRLEPGCFLVFDGQGIRRQRYWNVPVESNDASFNSAVEETESLLKSAVKYRLLSDRKVGCFLSGGIDSSLVTAITAEQSCGHVDTFSVGFDCPDYDESPYARRVAKHLGTTHHELVFNSKDLVELIEGFDSYFGEPFGDPSALPTMILSRMTRQHVTVALSGDGGDELFLGYDRYFFVQRLRWWLARIPRIMRPYLKMLLENSRCDKLERLAYPVGNPSGANLYAVLMSAIRPWDLEKVFNIDFLEACFGSSQIDLLRLFNRSSCPMLTLSDMSRFDVSRYLPDDILTKVDRCSMRYSLEARVPILDHRIAEYALRLDERVKTVTGPKAILKTILYKYVPRTLVDRPKKGFSVPLKEWFREDLKDCLLSKINGLDDRFNREELLRLADLHINHNRNYSYLFWNLLRVSHWCGKMRHQISA